MVETSSSNKNLCGSFDGRYSSPNAPFQITPCTNPERSLPKEDRSFLWELWYGGLNIAIDLKKDSHTLERHLIAALCAQKLQKHTAIGLPTAPLLEKNFLGV